MPQIPPPKVLTRYSAKLQTAWEQELRDTFHVAGRESHHAIAGTAVRYLRQPGKCIRPSLLLYSYELFSGRSAPARIVQLATSLELLHAYLLIHDDIMDQSPRRRGQPSLYKQYEDLHRRKKLTGNRKAFGRSVAMLIGDILSGAAEIIWTDEQPPAKARKLFDQLKQRVYWGQALDLALAAKPSTATSARVLKLMQEKSGMYSVAQPLMLGALLARPTQSPPSWVKAYGVNIGISFQLIDDVLGTFGSARQTGKSASSDITERKMTMLVITALQHSRGDNRRRLRQYYLAGRSASPVMIKRLLRQAKAGIMVERLADHYVRKALRAVQSANLKTRHKQELADFAAFIVRRKN